jgi:competence protein ComEC
MTLLYLTLAWTGGILLSHLLWSQGVIGCETPAWPFGLASGIAAGALILLRRRPAARLEAAAALFLLLGMWRYDVHPFAACPTPTDLSFYNEQDAHGAQVVVEGIVTGYPDARENHTNYTVSAESLTSGGQARQVQGQVLVQARHFPAYRYGDRLLVAGSLQEPPVFDDFDYRAYLARRGIYSQMRQPKTGRIASGQGSALLSLIYGLRESGARLLDRVLPEPAAALANGMLLGIEGGIPDDLYDAYRTAGVAHIIVISGSNISLLAGVLAFLIARPFGRRRAAVPVIIGVLLYVLLAGAQPPAVRAGLMAILFLVAVAIGRQSTAWVSLAAVALFMSALNPLTLWDASFQLSFMATLGLILFTPPMITALERWLERRSFKERTRRWIRAPAGLVIATLAAQVLVTPLMLYYFRQLSLISLPANLLVLPAQPPVMAGGLATLAAGLIWEPAGRILAAVPWVFLTYTNAVVKAAASIPLASVETGAPSALLVLLFYAVLFGVLLHGRGPSAAGGGPGATDRAPLPVARAVGWATAVAVPVWLGLSILSGAPDGRLHVVYGAGEESSTALVVTPGGRRLWVGDPIPERVRAPVQADQAGLGPYTQLPEVVISAGAAEVAEAGVGAIDPTQLPSGTAIKAGDGVTLTRFDAGEGWALGLRYGEFRTLLPPSLSQESQAALLGKAGEELYPSLLKAPGASGRDWLSLEFLTAAAPQLILWPDDAPCAPGVEAWLAEHGALRIPADAEVEVITDGEQMWLTQRSGAAER